MNRIEKLAFALDTLTIAAKLSETGDFKLELANEYFKLELEMQEYCTVALTDTDDKRRRAFDNDPDDTDYHLSPTKFYLKMRDVVDASDAQQMQALSDILHAATDAIAVKIAAFDATEAAFLGYFEN